MYFYKLKTKTKQNKTKQKNIKNYQKLGTVKIDFWSFIGTIQNILKVIIEYILN